MLWVGVIHCGGGWDDVGAGGMLWGMWDAVGGCSTLWGGWDVVAVCETLWGRVRRFGGM